MSTPGTTNRAVGLSRFGSPEVLGVVIVPVAAPGPLDALVRVRAAAVNPSDTLLRTGRQAERLGGISPPFIPGMDLAGNIVALGSAVAGTGLHVGQAEPELSGHGGTEDARQLDRQHSRQRRRNP